MKIKNMARAASVAAIYAALTLLLAPIGFGTLQFRVAEALCCLPILTNTAVWGLSVGCFAANLMGGCGLLDVVLGTLATLIGALGTKYFKNKPIIAMLCPVVSNSVIVGSMLYFAVPESPALLLNVLSVGSGEFLACIVLGLPLLRFLKKYPKIFN